jgi:hypothetical protein
MNLSYYIDSIRRMRFRQIYIRVFNKHITRMYYSRFANSRVPLENPVLPHLEFWSFSIPKEKLSEVRNQIPKKVDEIFENADHALINEIQVHYRKFHSDVIVDGEWNTHRNDDPEILYQTNRFRLFGVDLAKAYLYSDDGKYLDRLMDYIDSWIENSPKSKGVPWHSMNTSLRTYAWIWILHMVGDRFPDNFKDRFIGSLLAQIDHVYRYPEYEIWNNHLIYNGFTMWFGGNIFPEHPKAEKWRKKGERILEEECLNEFGEDGFNLEYCPSYHLMCTRLYEEYLLLGGNSRVIRKYTEKMVDSGLSMLKPDGTVPPLADHFLSFYETSNETDAEVVSILGAHLFNRADFLRWVGSDTEWPEWVYWYLGIDQLDRLRSMQIEQNGSYVSENSSYITLRDSMSSNAFYVNADVGDFGLNYCPGHAHADIGSFELSAYGENMVIDTGTFSYEETNRSKELKETRFHNTLQVDGLNQSIHWRYMRWVNLPKVTRTWIERSIEKNYYSFQVAHDGYSKSLDVDHTRIFMVNLDEKTLSFIDEVTFQGDHFLEHHFHLPDCELTHVTNGLIHIRFDTGSGLLIAYGEGLEHSSERVIISPHYGEEKEVTRLTISRNVSGPGMVRNAFLLVPLEDSSAYAMKEQGKERVIQVSGKEYRIPILPSD